MSALLSGAQLRAGRALLGATQRAVAERLGISTDSVLRAEVDRRGSERTKRRMRGLLVQAGVEFLADGSVRLMDAGPVIAGFIDARTERCKRARSAPDPTPVAAASTAALPPRPQPQPLPVTQLPPARREESAVVVLGQAAPVSPVNQPAPISAPSKPLPARREEPAATDWWEQQMRSDRPQWPSG